MKNDMEQIDSFKLAWDFAEGKTMSAMAREYKKSRDYIKYRISEHLSFSQIYDIIYFQRYPLMGERERAAKVKELGIDKKELVDKLPTFFCGDFRWGKFWRKLIKN